MQKHAACFVLAICFLSGCVDYDAGRERAIATAQSQCEREGKQFHMVSTRNDTEHESVVLTGHCLGPSDPGYVPQEAPPPK